MAMAAAEYSKRQRSVMGTALNAMSARRQCSELQLEKMCILIQKMCTSSGKSVYWESKARRMFRMCSVGSV